VAPREISVDVARYEDARTELDKQLGDDERLLLSPAGEHIGFYRNFERALTHVPADAAAAGRQHDGYPDRLGHCSFFLRIVSPSTRPS
jgi:hypothetical protein